MSPFAVLAIPFKSIIFIFLIAFSFNAYSETIDRIIAVVDESPILESDFIEYKNIISYENSKLPTPVDIKSDNDLLDDLIIRTIQLNKAKDSGIKMSDNQLNNFLSEDLRKRGLDPANIISELSDFPGGVDSFRSFFRDNIIIHELQSMAIRSSVVVSDLEARTFLTSEQGRMNSQLVYEISFISLPDDKVDIPLDKVLVENISSILKEDESFEVILNKLQSKYNWISGKLLEPRAINNIPTIFSSVVPLLEKQEVSKPLYEGDKVYFVKVINVSGSKPILEDLVHSRHILLKPSIVRNDSQAELEITALRDRIISGESFNTIAKTYTDDSASKNSGGDLGWKPYKQFTPAFSEVVNNIPIGKVSEPFKSPFGWHIAQVLSRKQEDVSERQELDAIRNYQFQQKIQDELPRFLNQIRESSYIEIISPEFASN